VPRVFILVYFASFRRRFAPSEMDLLALAWMSNGG
jgi:hypothetical protein